MARTPAAQSLSARRSRLALAAFMAAGSAVSSTALAQFSWNVNAPGTFFWSNSLNWSPAAPPGGPNGAGTDVVIGDITGLGFPNNDDINTLGPAFGPAYWDTIFRQVRLDTAGVHIRSLLIEEYPASPAPGHRNVLTLDNDVQVDQGITLRGTRAVLELNGHTATGNVTVEAPVLLGGDRWHRNRIGANVSLDDGLNADLPGSPGSNYPFLTVTPESLLYHKALYHQTPLVFHTNTPLLDSSEPVSNGGTSGTISGNLDTQGIVWLNQNSTINGTTNNHSAFGYYRYDGSLGNQMFFQAAVNNQDAHAAMDIDGRGWFNTSVTNQNLGTMYTRARTDVRTTWTNATGGEFLYQPTHNYGDPYAYESSFRHDCFNLNLNGLNSGYAFAPALNSPNPAPAPPQLVAPNFGAPAAPVAGVDVKYPYLALGEFDGNIVQGDTQHDIEFRNENGAVLNFRGNVKLGLINRHPVGFENTQIIDFALDRISSLFNTTGAEFTYDPRTPASQNMDITGEIVNTGTLVLPVSPLHAGAPSSVNLHAQMNLFGNTLVRGRFSPARGPSGVLLTNTNGAVLNYAARVDIGQDNLFNPDILQPVVAGNLDNTGGTINGFDDGNLILHGGNQTNAGTINLSDTAQFTTGDQGSSTFNNNGLLAGVVYTGPRPQDRSDYDTYTPVANGTPVLHAGTLNNNVGAQIRVDTSVTLTLDSSAINNFGNVNLNGGKLITRDGSINYGSTTFNGGDIAGPFLLNLPGGLLNGFGGQVDSLTLLNSSGATMTLGNGLANSLQINSTSFTQAGAVNMAAAFNLVTNNTALTNSGTITMSGLNGNLASPGRIITNLGTITGSGLIGFANAFTGGVLTNQFVNNSAASVNVGALGMSIGGVSMPLNNGTINIGAGSGLSIVAAGVASTFTNSGTINLASALNDGGLNRGLANQGTIAGSGAINFISGIANTSSGFMSASGVGMFLNPGNLAPVSNLGIMAIQPGSQMVIPNVVFTNQGAVNFVGNGSLNNAGNATGFINATGANVNVAGGNDAIDFNAAVAASVVNFGTMTVAGGTLHINPTLGLDFDNSGSVRVQNGGLFDAFDVVNRASGTLDASRLAGDAAGSVLDLGDLDNLGTVRVAGLGSTLNTNSGAAVTTNGGQVILDAGATWNNGPGGGQDITNVNLGAPGTVTVENGSSLFAAAFSNPLTGSTLHLTEGSFATLTNITNSGVIRVDAGSTLLGFNVTNAGSGDIQITGGSTASVQRLNTIGSVRVFGAGSVLNTNSALGTLNGGQIILDSSAVWNNGPGGGQNVTNANLGFPGSVLVENNSSLFAAAFTNPIAGSVLHVTNSSFATLTNITNSGSVVVDSRSTLLGFDTVNTGPGTIAVVRNPGDATGSAMRILDLDNLGTVRVFGTGSTLDTDSRVLLNTRNGGQVILDTNAAWTNGPGGGQDIINANGGFPGSVLVENGSSLFAGDVTNSLAGSLLHVTTNSFATLVDLDNRGTIRVDNTSTLLAFNVLNRETGVIDIANAAGQGANFISSLDLDNRGLVRIEGALSRLDTDNRNTGAASNRSQIVVDDGGVWNNGPAGARQPITNGVAPFDGDIIVNNTSTLNAGVLTNVTGSSMLKVSGAGSVANLTGLVNNGFVIADPGGVVNVGGAVTNTGNVSVDGAGSALNTFGSNWTNTSGEVTVTRAGALDLTGLLGVLRGSWTSAAGGLSVDGVGSIARTGTVTINGGSTLSLTAGGVLTTGLAIGSAVTSTDSAITVNGAGSNIFASSLTLGASSVQVAAGGIIDANFGVTIGNNGGGVGSEVTVDGGASRLNILNPLLGTLSVTVPSTLSIGNGAIVTAQGGGTNRGNISLDLGARFSTTVMDNRFGSYNAARGSTTTDTGAWDNTNGGTVVVGTCTFTSGAFTNDGGFFRIGGTSNATVGAVSNLNAGGAIGNIAVDATSSLVTGTINNTGSSVTVTNGSVLATGPVGGPFAAMTSNTSAVDVGGTALLITGAYAQTGGETTIGGGSAASTGTFTLTGGELNLNNASAVGGIFVNTLLVNGNLTNTGGSISALGGANPRVKGTFTNASSTSLQGASSLLTRDISNGGSISLETGSSLDSRETGARRPFTNTGGSLTASGGSTVTVGDVNTTIGAIAFGGAAFFDTLNYTQTGGEFHIGGGAAADMFNFTLTDGFTTLLNASTRPGVPDTLHTLDMTINGGSLSAKGGATVNVTGNLAINNNSTGNVLVDGPGSDIRAGQIDNQGTVTVSDNAVLRSNQNGTFQPFNNNGTLDITRNTARVLSFTFFNGGAVTLSLNAQLDTNGGDFNNQGSVLQINGTSTLTCATFLNQSANTSVLGTSTVNCVNITNLTDHAVIAFDRSRLNSTGLMTNNGTLDLVESQATFGVALHTNAGSGTIDVNTTSTATWNTLVNDGTVVASTNSTVNLATYDNRGTTTVRSTGTTFNVGAGYSGPGRVNVDSGGKFTAGTATFGAGSLLTVNGAGSNFRSNFNLVTNGSVQTSSTGTINVANDMIMNAGAFTSLTGAGSDITVVGNLAMNGVAGNIASVKVSNGARFIVGGNINTPPAGVPNAVNKYNVDPAFMDIGGSFNLYHDDELRVDDLSVVTVGGSVRNEMHSPNFWSYDGTLRMNGGGPLQGYEVSGHDFGNLFGVGTPYPTLNDLFSLAYVNNFNIGDPYSHGLGTLHLTVGSSLLVLNDYNNSLGGPGGGFDDFGLVGPTGLPVHSTSELLAGGEALYLERLVIDPGTHLSLGMLHIYYREVSFDGGAHFISGTFGDVVTWGTMGVTFAPGLDGVSRWPIPFIPAPGSASLLVAAGVLGMRRRRRNP